MAALSRSSIRKPKTDTIIRYTHITYCWPGGEEETHKMSKEEIEWHENEERCRKTQLSIREALGVGVSKQKNVFGSTLKTLHPTSAIHSTTETVTIQEETDLNNDGNDTEGM
ncbi:hypothetical protein PT974_12178 [Cladobotryum mycophilum]|uniref:Uncharacterized protein n=1 Tax=Cladobotryum mycophilum TaxID=491253 RepID=A0ABR0S794_9HYPO